MQNAKRELQPNPNPHLLKGGKNEMNFYQAHKLYGQWHLNSIFISLHLNFPINFSKSQYRNYK